jgi:hypothetical protein
MKMTRKSTPFKSPGVRHMAEGGTAKRKVMKRGKDGSMTELKGANADKVRAAVKAGKTKNIQGGTKLAQMLGINKTYNVVSGGGSSSGSKPRVSTSGGAAKTSKRPPTKSKARGMSNTDQMRAKTRGKTDTSSPKDTNDPRNASAPKAKTSGPAKGVRTKPNAAAQAKIDAYKKTKRDYPGGKDVGRGDPQKAKRKSTDAELSRRTSERNSTRRNAIGAPYARQEQTARAVKKANAARESGKAVDVEKIKSTVGSRGRAARRKKD